MALVALAVSRRPLQTDYLISEGKLLQTQNGCKLKFATCCKCNTMPIKQTAKRLEASDGCTELGRRLMEKRNGQADGRSCISMSL